MRSSDRFSRSAQGGGSGVTGIDDAIAATLPLNALTARQALVLAGDREGFVLGRGVGGRQQRAAAISGCGPTVRKSANHSVKMDFTT